MRLIFILLLPNQYFVIIEKIIMQKSVMNKAPNKNNFNSHLQPNSDRAVVGEHFRGILARTKRWPTFQWQLVA